MLNEQSLLTKSVDSSNSSFFISNKSIFRKNLDVGNHMCLTESMFFRILELAESSSLLVNSKSTLEIRWPRKGWERNLQIGDVVSVKFNHIVPPASGKKIISRLVKLQQPTSSINIFDLVPFDWVQDRSLIQRASAILNSISEAHRLLFNAIFWNADRFKRFCIQPSSLIGHHSELNGNLRHTVEVAEFMCKLCTERSFANLDLGILAALLHDSGKSDEYIATNHGSWYMSERGKLLGHKITALEWISAATAKWNIQLPKDHYEGLLHVLTAAPNAPEWLGIRQPALPEAHLLSIADRLSGSDDLMHKTVNISGGFGQSHKHLKSPPFLVRG